MEIIPYFLSPENGIIGSIPAIATNLRTIESGRTAKIRPDYLTQ